MIQPDTLFLSARDDFSVVEVSDLAGIQRLHDEGDPSGIETFELRESSDLFTPLKTLEAKAPLVEEVDDSEWQRTVGACLMRRYVTIANRA